MQRFFGLVRSFGGDEDHPTVTNFGQLFRLLSLYTPVKLAVKGNCEGGNDQVLLSAFDSLGEKRREALQKKNAVKEEVWKRLKRIPFHDLCNLPDDHTYNVLSPEETAQYYLAGYVAFKVNRAADCADCKKDLVGSQDALPAEALLIIERAHVSGCLVYPSRKLFACISTIEKTVSQESEQATFGDVFWRVLDSLIENGTNTVGCSQHCSEFTGKVIHFYLVTRMHFFARKKCQENDSAVKAQRERKKAKLV